MKKGSWPSEADYKAIRQKVAATPEGRKEIERVSNLQLPKNADDLAERLIFTVLTSGFGYIPAKSVFPGVKSALLAGKPVYPKAFANKNKAGAIERIWLARRDLFAKSKMLSSEKQWLKWCGQIPYVRGPAVRYHALRNLAALDVAKPDRLMKRIAKRAGESVADMCERLSKLSGDRVGVVDVVLWYAASVGIIEGISHSRRIVRCAPAKP
jgi:hypothetical protein